MKVQKISSNVLESVTKKLCVASRQHCTTTNHIRPYQVIGYMKMLKGFSTFFGNRLILQLRVKQLGFTVFEYIQTIF